MEWQAHGYTVPRIAVNVSPRQLYQRNFVGMVERILAITGFDPERSELELTESMAVQKSERCRAFHRDLRGMGTMTGADDFCTVHSSPTTSKQFPENTADTVSTY